MKRVYVVRTKENDVLPQFVFFSTDSVDEALNYLRNIDSPGEYEVILIREDFVSERKVEETPEYHEKMRQRANRYGLEWRGGE